MDIEKKFVRNYLSFPKFKTGTIAGFFFLTLCLIGSLFYWDTSSFISPYLSANQELIFQRHEYWRLLTTTFIHGDIHHLMSNSLMLFILTYFVTAFYGLGISLFYAPLMGMAINYLVISQYQTETTLVGASGVVYFLWGFWLILYIFINKHMSMIKRLVRVFGIFLILLVPTTYSPTTSYLAHYVGFALGLGSGLIYYLFKHHEFSKYEFWEYRVIEPDNENVDSFHSPQNLLQ